PVKNERPIPLPFWNGLGCLLNVGSRSQNPRYRRIREGIFWRIRGGSSSRPHSRRPLDLWRSRWNVRSSSGRAADQDRRNPQPSEDEAQVVADGGEDDVGAVPRRGL